MSVLPFRDHLPVLCKPLKGQQEILKLHSLAVSVLVVDFPSNELCHYFFCFTIPGNDVQSLKGDRL